MPTIIHPEFGELEVSDAFGKMAPAKQQQYIDAKLNLRDGSGVENKGVVGGRGIGKDIASSFGAGNIGTGSGNIKGQLGPSTPGNEESSLDEIAAQEAMIKDQVLGLPSVQELENLWNELPEAEKNSFLSNSPVVASIASFADNVLPIPLLWALPPNVQAKIQNAIQQNPEAAKKAGAVGFITGLVGGPIAIAQIAKGGIKLIKNSALKTAGRKSSKQLQEWQAGAKKVIAELKDAGKSSSKGAKALQQQYDEVDDVLKDWYSYIYQHNLKPQQIRGFLIDRINQLPKDHPLKTVAGKNGDLMHTILDIRPKGKVAPTSWKDSVKKRIGHNLELAGANIWSTVAETSLSFAGGMGSTYSQALRNFNEQGLEPEEAKSLALYYTINRTPYDVAVTGVNLALGEGKGQILVDALLKLTIAIPDLDMEGNLSPDLISEGMGNEPVQKNYGGLIGTPNMLSIPKRMPGLLGM